MFREIRAGAGVRTWRRSAAMAALACVLAAPSAEAFAQPNVMKVEISAQPLAQALMRLSRQMNVDIVAPGRLTRNATAPAISGSMTVEQALDRLLANSALRYRKRGDGFVIESGRTASPGVSGGHVATAQAVASRSNGAVVGQEVPDALVGDAVGSSNDIIVTAQKREERVGDVPASVTVIKPQQLLQSGKTRLQDYFYQVPGLSLTTGSFGGGGTQYPTIRGLSAGQIQNATVVTVIDDVPVGSVIQQNAGGATQPDLDPSDLARVEVLKGPQGTLYGAASLGGLIKFVTADPSTVAFSGRGEVSGQAAAHGGFGYSVRGAVNIPVSSTFAVRASAFNREDPGFIDNLTTGEKDFNTAHAYGGRLSALWRPSDTLTVKLAALFQQVDGNASYVNSDIAGGYPQGRRGFTRLPQAENYSNRIALYTAVVNWRAGAFNLASLTAYSTNLSRSSVDLTACCAALFGTTFFPSANAAVDLVRFQTNRFSQELRVSSGIGTFLDWQIGGFYDRERTPDSGETISAADLGTGAVLGRSYVVRTELPLEDYAIFGNLTFHIGDRFSVEAGGRQAWNRQRPRVIATGPGVPVLQGLPEPYIVAGEANGHAFTYRVAPKFKLSDDVLVYANLASGYRIGGPNNNAAAAAVQGIFFPATYRPDRTANYEIGLKGTLLDRHLTVNAALYRIDWKDFQINLIGRNGNFQQAYIANAGDARSQGFELAVEARPWTGMTLSINGSIGKAELAEDLPASSTAFGLKGDRLPYSTRYNGNVSAEQDFPLGGDWTGVVAGSVNYVGSKFQEFIAASAPPDSRIRLPAFTTFDIRTGASGAGWTANLFINNLTDRRARSVLVSSSAFGVTGGYYASLIQPRTIGISVSRDFR